MSHAGVRPLASRGKCLTMQFFHFTKKWEHRFLSWCFSFPTTWSSFSVCVHAQLCLTLCEPMGLCPKNFLGKNTEVDCHFLLQGIFLTEGMNPRPLCVLHWQADSFFFFLFLFFNHWSPGKPRPHRAGNFLGDLVVQSPPFRGLLVVQC